MDNSHDSMILVDLFDRPLGAAGKLETHQKGLLHRAFSVFITDMEGRRILIQRRAPGKYHSGGLWANACCSHPRPGEDTRAAALRRLAEETGLCCPLRELFSFVYRQSFPGGLAEYEFDHVLIGTCAEGAADLRPDPEEIAELCWVDRDTLARDMLERPERYAAWFIIACPRVLAGLPGAAAAGI